MTDYREIIGLSSLKFSNVFIANSDIEQLFYPDRGNKGRKLPDYEYIYKSEQFLV